MGRQREETSRRYAALFYSLPVRRARICAARTCDGVHPDAGQGKATEIDGIDGIIAMMPPGAATGGCGGEIEVTAGVPVVVWPPAASMV